MVKINLAVGGKRHRKSLQFSIGARGSSGTGCSRFICASQLTSVDGIPKPNNALLTNIPALATFGVASCFGWLLRPQPRGQELFTRHRLVNLLAALGLTVLALANAALRMSNVELSG